MRQCVLLCIPLKPATKSRTKRLPQLLFCGHHICPQPLEVLLHGLHCCLWPPPHNVDAVDPLALGNLNHQLQVAARGQGEEVGLLDLLQ